MTKMALTLGGKFKRGGLNITKYNWVLLAFVRYLTNNNYIVILMETVKKKREIEIYNHNKKCIFCLAYCKIWCSFLRCNLCYFKIYFLCLVIFWFYDFCIWQVHSMKLFSLTCNYVSDNWILIFIINHVAWKCEIHISSELTHFQGKCRLVILKSSVIID